MKILVLSALAIGMLEGAAIADASSAEDLYDQGQAAFDHKDYATAITRWQASYQASGEPGLLFNLAQAQRLAGDCPDALATYHRFLAADPASDQHQIAVDFARELEGKCGTQKPPRPRPEPKLVPKPLPKIEPVIVAEPTLHTIAPDTEERRGRSLRITGIATGGAGVAVFVTGLYFGHRAQATGDEVTSACHAGCDWSAWKGKDADGRRDATIGHVLDVAGAAGIVGGAILYYAGMHQTVAVVPESRGAGAVVTWGGTW